MHDCRFLVANFIEANNEASHRALADRNENLTFRIETESTTCRIFQQTLNKFKVSAAEQTEPRAIVQRTYADIVVSKA
jgi:uncharacterized protein YaaW (UPF0174 family)